MKEICDFNELTDIMETHAGLGVSIPDSMEFHRIKDTSVPSSYNGQKSLDEVGMRVSEPFDVIEFDRAYTRLRSDIIKKASSKKEENS